MGSGFFKLGEARGFWLSVGPPNGFGGRVVFFNGPPNGFRIFFQWSAQRAREGFRIFFQWSAQRAREDSFFNGSPNGPGRGKKCRKQGAWGVVC